MGSRIAVNLLACALFAFCTPTALADTWIVDDDGSADFADLQNAIDAASNGDLIRVSAGVYDLFAIDGKAVTVLGGPGAVIKTAPPDYHVSIRNIGGDQVVILAELELPQLEVMDCAGTVVLDSLVLTDASGFINSPPAILDVWGASDLRVTRSHVQHLVSGSLLFGIQKEGPGVRVMPRGSQLSRVELIQCTVFGRAGKLAGADDVASHGGPGLEAGGGCSVGAFSSNLTGGQAGTMCSDYLPPTLGGAGVLATGASSILLAGGGVESVEGGTGGVNDDGMAGSGAPGTLLVSGPVQPTRFRHSNVSLVGGLDWYGKSQAPPIQSIGPLPNAIYVPVQPDPVIELVEPLVAQAAASLCVRAVPGSTIELALGFTPAVRSLGNSEIEALVIPDRVIDLGLVPPSGQLDFTVPEFASLPTGTLLIAQATVDFPNGARERTNSLPLVAR